MIITVSKEYKEIDFNDPARHYDNKMVETGCIDNYSISRKIGKGRYSEVFEGLDSNNKKIVIKVIKPVRIEKVSREVVILKNLNHKNIIKLLDVVFDPDSECFSLIFDYKKSQNFLYLKIPGLETIKLYFKQILEGLAHSHSKGIIHRDLKPQNIVLYTDEKIVKIIDWGLAEFYTPNREYSIRVASRFYKAPELLLGYSYYDYSVDIFAFGCMLAEVFFLRRPFFSGLDSFEQIDEIINVLGINDFSKYLHKYDIPDGVLERISHLNNDRVDFKTFIEDVEHEYYKDEYFTESCIDLLNKILVYDHTERLSARECLIHQFFN